MSMPAASAAAIGSLCFPISRIRPSSFRPRMTAIRSGAGVDTINHVLTKLQKECATPLPVLRHVADSMANDMRAGLAVDGGSDLKMILSYVDALPTGNEKGLFYALDLGGTNFRVLRVQLGGMDQRVIATEAEQVSIPQELMSGTSEELFDFIASGLAKFAEKESGEFQLSQGRNRELGFTFSFPVKQTSIDSGILIKWTKGFAVSGTAGKDVVACLNEAMKRQGLAMQVSALVNDTVGTLAGAKYWDNDVMVAVILGTGTNACYVERTDAIPKSPGKKSQSGTTIINTEWGAFSTGLPLTEFDRGMDAESINPGEQIFEKTISGMYLGEIVRRVVLKMAEAESLFGNSIPEKLQTPFSLRTPHICAMQQDTSNDLDAVGSILFNEAGIESNVRARQIVLEVCDTIAKRGGRLAGAGIVGILQKMAVMVNRMKSDKGMLAGNDDFKRCFVMFSMVTLLAPTTNRRADLKLVLALEDVEEISRYNWCQYALDNLCDKLSSYKDSVKYVAGCIIFLQLCYFHRVQIQGNVLDSSLPLIRHWSDGLIKERISLENGNYGQGVLDKVIYPVTKAEVAGQSTKVQKKKKIVQEKKRRQRSDFTRGGQEDKGKQEKKRGGGGRR